MGHSLRAGFAWAIRPPAPPCCVPVTVPPLPHEGLREYLLLFSVKGLV